MHIVKTKNKKVICLVFPLVAILFSGCVHNTKEISINPKELFQYYDEMYWSSTIYGATSYDIREIEKQIGGFWNYYNEYEKSHQKLDEVIKNWEADFLTEGTYIVGKDIPEGWYVFCNDEDDDNAFCDQDSIDNNMLDIWISEHFVCQNFDEGEIVKVKGTPKFAYIDEFPGFTNADDGNYYGKFYQIGKDIPEGKYFVLSMNIEGGTYTCFTNGNNFGTTAGVGEYGRYAGNRFSYAYLTREDEYVYMKDCVLIPIEQKPQIQPILHENISYSNREQSSFEKCVKDLLSRQKNYDKHIYVEGEYIIGQDIPLGTYQIQDEIAREVNDLESEEYYSDCAVPLYSDMNYSWTGLVIPYEEEAKRCGWQFMRTSRWIYNKELQSKCVEIKTVDGLTEYKIVEGKNLPTIVFDESYTGCVVRLVRVILIPED